MSIPLPDTGLPALAPLLNGDLWARWAAAGQVFALDDVRAAVHYVRLKPGVSCRLTVFSGEGGREDDPPPGFLVLLYPDAERARQSYQKESSRAHLIGSRGWRPFLSEDPPAVLLPFPNDPDIPALRRVYQPRAFRRLLMESLRDWPDDEWRMKKRGLLSTLLAYKPGRRAVYRIDMKLRRQDQTDKAHIQLHAKLGPADVVQQSREKLCAIAAATRTARHFGVPRPQNPTLKGSLFACEWIHGSPLDMQAAAPPRHALLQQAGRALAELHGLPVALPALTALADRGPTIAALARDLAGTFPEGAARIDAISALLQSRLAALNPGPDVLAHGDLHPAQMLWNEAGMPQLLDFDSAGCGSALLDLGSWHARDLEAGLGPSALEPFLAGYREVREIALTTQQLAVSTALALFHRCVFPLRSLQPNWQQQTDAMLRQIEQLLASKGQ